MFRHLITFLLVSFFTLTLSAQHPQFATAPSPTEPVAGWISTSKVNPQSLSEVDYFTGKASIGIPIYQSKIGELDFKLSLDYSSSGIKVTPSASNVGLGWSLSSGYRLSRVVRGNADDELDQGDLYFMDYSGTTGAPECRQRVKGFWRNSNSVSLTTSSTGSDVKSYYLTNQDPEMDVFFLTLNGKNIEFVIGKNGEVFTLSPCDWKVEYFYNTQTIDNIPPNSLVDKFIITDEHGTKYTFIAHDVKPGASGIVVQPTDPAQESGGGRRVPVSEWEIDKIVDNHGRTIQFNYFFNFNEKDYQGTTKLENHPGGLPQATCYRNAVNVQPGGVVFPYNVFGKKPAYLESISLPNGVSIQFLYGSQPRRDMYREDTYNWRSLPLKEIQINSNGYFTHSFQLHQSYFDFSQPSGTLLYSSTIYNTTQYLAGSNFWSWRSKTWNLRLKLDSIVVSPNQYNQKYLFSYNMTNMLPTREFQGDNWDYYASYPTANMLTKIAFSDKSSIEYEFEPNNGRFFTTTGLESSYSNGAGVRIKKITLFDGINHNNDIIKKFEYLNDDNTGSGIFLSKPTFGKSLTCYIDGNSVFTTNNSLASAWGFTKSGCPIGYSNIRVIYGNNGEGGKEVYTFSNAVEGSILNIISNVSPAPPYVNRQYLKSWAIGLLKQKRVYDANNSLKLETINEYNLGELQPTNLPMFKSLFYDIKAGDPAGINNGNCSNANIPWDFYKIEYYPTKGYSLLSKSTTIEYATQGNLTSVKEYTYDNKFKVKKEITKNSDGKYFEKRFYRVYDYNSSGNTGFNTLTAANRSTELIRTDHLVKDNLSAPYKYLESTIKSYSDILFDPGLGIYRVEPTTVYKLNAPQPIAETTLGSSINPAQSVPTGSPYYYKDETLKYNSLGLVTEINNKGRNSAVLYDDYNNIIAEAINAKESDIAYSSFEGIGSSIVEGGWILNPSFFISGGYSGDRSAMATRNSIDIQKLLDPGKTYKISLWAKSGVPVVGFNTGSNLTLSSIGDVTADGWTYYAGTFSGKTFCKILSGSQVDEVRLYPVGALMKTYTYKPFFGLTSEVNEQSTAKSYYYDFLGRLIEIADKDHKIIKQYRYGNGIQN